MTLSASLMYAGITIARIRNALNTDVPRAMLRIRNGPAALSSFDYDGAQAYADRLTWEVFSHHQDDVTAFRESLHTLIAVDVPTWCHLIPFGRDVLLRNLTDNEAQCFQIARLVDSCDADVVVWWDRCAALVRRLDEPDLLSIGRTGERRTFEREQLLLAPHGLSPTWVALDDNTAGFDVQTWRPGGGGWGELRPWYIEVKTSGRQSRFFLTRNEWRFAQRHPDSWEVQFWLQEQADPICLSFDSVTQSVPADVGSGQWVTIEIVVGGEEQQ